jgi:hypothetical protein
MAQLSFRERYKQDTRFKTAVDELASDFQMARMGVDLEKLAQAWTPGEGLSAEVKGLGSKAKVVVTKTKPAPEPDIQPESDPEPEPEADGEPEATADPEPEPSADE